MNAEEAEFTEEYIANLPLDPKDTKKDEETKVTNYNRKRRKNTQKQRKLKRKRVMVIEGNTKR